MNKNFKILSFLVVIILNACLVFSGYPVPAGGCTGGPGVQIGDYCYNCGENDGVCPDNFAANTCGLTKPDIDCFIDVACDRNERQTENICNIDGQCKWCAACNNKLSYTASSLCISSQAACSGYSCVKDKCGAQCCSNGDCGTTYCDPNGNLHLTGSCGNECTLNVCVTCNPWNWGACKCADGWTDANNNMADGCEAQIPSKCNDRNAFSCFWDTKCDWCNSCSNNAYSGDKSKCVDKGTCSHSCVVGQCTATCNEGTSDSGIDYCSNGDIYNKISGCKTCLWDDASAQDTLAQTCLDNCADTDNGKEFFVKGTVTDNDKCTSGDKCPSNPYIDFCSGATLNEYFCSVNTFSKITKNCDEYDTLNCAIEVNGDKLIKRCDNWGCSNGACADTGQDILTTLGTSTGSCSILNGYKDYYTNAGANTWGINAESSESACSDGKNNDCDVPIDCADSDCAGKTGVNNAICCQDANNCGIKSCDASIHLTGSCQNQCSSNKCQDCSLSCSCMPGYVDKDKQDSNGCEYQCSATNNGVEICDGLDNDCDGPIDEDLTAPLNNNQNGVCTGSRKICNGVNGWQNSYSSILNYQSSESSCDDGLDNDCDTEKDWDTAMYAPDPKNGFTRGTEKGDYNCAVSVNNIEILTLGPYFDNSKIDVGCTMSVGGINSVRSFVGDKECVWDSATGSEWSGNKAIFKKCDVGSAGNKEVKCSVYSDRSYQSGVDKTTSITVQTSQCSSYSYDTCPTQICDKCVKCSNTKWNGLSENKCVIKGSCNIYQCNVFQTGEDGNTCGASCDDSIGCTDTTKCEGVIYKTRTGNCDLNACGCSYSSWQSGTCAQSKANCNAECASGDVFDTGADYCSNGIIYNKINGCNSNCAFYDDGSSSDTQSVICENKCIGSTDQTTFTVKDDVTDYDTACDGNNCKSAVKEDYCQTNLFGNPTNTLKEAYCDGNNFVYGEKDCNNYDIPAINGNTCSWTDGSCGNGVCSTVSGGVDCNIFKDTDGSDGTLKDSIATGQKCAVGCSSENCCSVTSYTAAGSCNVITVGSTNYIDYYSNSGSKLFGVVPLPLENSCSDGNDNDCDGAIDGNNGASSDTDCCSYTGAEICDGLDNDCDGNIDENFWGNPLTQACYTGAGGTKDVGVCKGGTQTCSGGAWGVCAGEVIPSNEVCNDGNDNDCDSSKDCVDSDCLGRNVNKGGVGPGGVICCQDKSLDCPADGAEGFNGCSNDDSRTGGIASFECKSNICASKIINTIGACNNGCCLPGKVVGQGGASCVGPGRNSMMDIDKDGKHEICSVRSPGDWIGANCVGEDCVDDPTQPLDYNCDTVADCTENPGECGEKICNGYICATQAKSDAKSICEGFITTRGYECAYYTGCNKAGAGTEWNCAYGGNSEKCDSFDEACVGKNYKCENICVLPEVINNPCCLCYSQCEALVNDPNKPSNQAPFVIQNCVRHGQWTNIDCPYGGS